MATVIGQEVVDPGEYKIIGTRPVRHDGVDKVTGRAKYGADVQLAGMLHGKILRSPHAHAKILSIDTSKAVALPGVKAIVTSADFPILKDQSLDFGETQGNIRMLAENILANQKVLYKGHAILAIAATDQHIAEEALDLVEVKYEHLTPSQLRERLFERSGYFMPNPPLPAKISRNRGGGWRLPR